MIKIILLDMWRSFVVNSEIAIIIDIMLADININLEPFLFLSKTYPDAMIKKLNNIADIVKKSAI